MGLLVTAADAARLAHVSERTVRTWLTAEPPKLRAEKRQPAGRPAAWAIDVDELARVPGVIIDRDALAQLETRETRTAENMAARLATLEREVQTLRSRLRMVELRQGPAESGSGTWASQGPSVDMSPANASDGLANNAERETVYRPLSAPTVPPSPPRDAYVGTGSHTFRTRADAARWLARHGIESEHTPKTWPGWQDVALTPESALLLAGSLQGRRNAHWRLHRCDDPACVCRTLLAE